MMYSIEYEMSPPFLPVVCCRESCVAMDSTLKRDRAVVVGAWVGRRNRCGWRRLSPSSADFVFRCLFFWLGFPSTLLKLGRTNLQIDLLISNACCGQIPDIGFLRSFVRTGFRIYRLPRSCPCPVSNFSLRQSFVLPFWATTIAVIQFPSVLYCLLNGFRFYCCCVVDRFSILLHTRYSSCRSVFEFLPQRWIRFRLVCCECSESVFDCARLCFPPPSRVLSLLSSATFRNRFVAMMSRGGVGAAAGCCSHSTMYERCRHTSKVL